MRWVIYISFSIMIIFMFSFGIFGVTLDKGAASSIKTFLYGKPSENFTLIERLKTPKIWTDASTQAMHSLEIEFWATYGCYNRFE